jgi:hypothetical protein
LSPFFTAVPARRELTFFFRKTTTSSLFLRNRTFPAVLQSGAFLVLRHYGLFAAELDFITWMAHLRIIFPVTLISAGKPIKKASQGA